jgi:hypothetical protein
MNWKIEIIEDWDTIWSEEFQKRWLDVLDQSPNSHVFFHPALVKAWIDTYRPIRKLKLIFVMGSHDSVNILFPLVLWTKNWKNAFLKVIVPIGYSDYDYHDPIFSQEGNEIIIQKFYRQLLIVLSQNYSFDEIVFDGLHALYIPNGFNVQLEEPCPHINIESHDGIDSYLGSLSKDVRKSFNRRKRNLEASANLLYTVCDSPQSYSKVRYLFPKMMEYHSLRWPNAYKPPRFHENLIKEGLGSSVLLFYAIQDGKNLISTQIAFIYKNKLLLYMPTISSQYASFSPGRISLVYCIEDAYKRGLKVVDQLRGAELYKSEWTADYDTIYNVNNLSNRFLSQLKRSLLFVRKKLIR